MKLKSLLLNGFNVPIERGEGCGNTFLLFDCLQLTDIEQVIEKAYPLLIDEKLDDALILKKVRESDQEIILEMIVLEPDKSIAEFCGNGARVTACYLKQKFGDERNYYLKTSKGLKKIGWEGDLFHIDMGKTEVRSRKGKFFGSPFETFNLGLGMRQFTFFWTETLEPHFVTFEDISENELSDLGLYLNFQQRSFFPLGVNLNKAEIISEKGLKVTTFERGVNRITAACGTGATSSAMLALASGRIQKQSFIDVYLKGGKLTIHQDKQKVTLIGPARLEKSK